MEAGFRKRSCSSKKSAAATSRRRALSSVPAGDGASGVSRPRAPDIDAGKQEQPHHVDEVPVPGGELEAEVLLRREMAQISADQAHDQKDRADDHVSAVEAGRHEERGAVDIA